MGPEEVLLQTDALSPAPCHALPAPTHCLCHSWALCFSGVSPCLTLSICLCDSVSDLSISLNLDGSHSVSLCLQGLSLTLDKPLCGSLMSSCSDLKAMGASDLGGERKPACAKVGRQDVLDAQWTARSLLDSVCIRLGARKGKLSKAYLPLMTVSNAGHCLFFKQVAGLPGPSHHLYPMKSRRDGF